MNPPAHARFFERHPRVQGLFHSGVKRVLDLCIVRLAFQAKHNTRAVKAKRDRDRANNLFRALALSLMFPGRAGRACLGCSLSPSRRRHIDRVWFASCAFQHNVLTRKPIAPAPAAVQPHGNLFELTCEPMLCNGLSSKEPMVSVAQRWRHGRDWFSELLGSERLLLGFPLRNNIISPHFPRPSIGFC